MDRLRPKLQYITERGGSQIKERWCKKVRLNQTNKSGKKNKWRILKAASYQTVLEEGFRRCPWVTVQRWRARRLCCQSKARGRWVLGRTVERKWEKKKKSIHHKALKSWWTHTIFKAVDNRGFTVTVLVCVSNMHRNTKNPPFYPVLRCNYWSAGTNCPPLQPSKSPTEHNFMTMPHVCSVGNEWLSSEDAWMEIWVGGALRSLQAVWHAWLSNTNISFLSATHPYVGDESRPLHPVNTVWICCWC